MATRLQNAKEKWRGMKSSSGFHNLMLFLAFVAVATLFWLILALNDSVTQTFDVKLRIENIPDSVTFINDPPAEFHVTIRDKGTNILRSGVMNTPHVDINFRDFSNKGIFRFTRSDMNSALKSTFGNSAQITATSLDSLYLHYTTGKGRRVPIVICADVTAAPGYVISESPEPMERAVMLYSYSDNIDTITRVYTEEIIKRNLSETAELKVKLRPVSHAKIEPSTITVRIPVEPYVKKESMATVQADNVPRGESLLLFPPRVHVTYYVPMSLFNSDLVPVDVRVDYLDIKRTPANRIPVRIKSYADYVANPELGVDSVEYTLAR